MGKNRPGVGLIDPTIDCWSLIHSRAVATSRLRRKSPGPLGGLQPLATETARTGLILSAVCMVRQDCGTTVATLRPSGYAAD